MPDYAMSDNGTITIANTDGSSVQMDGRNIRFANGGIYSDAIYGRTILASDMARMQPEEPNKRYIQQYNYIPEQFQFHKVNTEEELYFGVELEIDNGGEDETNAQYVNDFMNSTVENIYCKHDGSLRNGFEIVTHPCTIEYHKQLKYDELFKELVKRNYRSHDVGTCGLHIHMNRNYFGDKKLDQDLNISKLLYLYEKFWDKVELVSRRKSNGYAKRFYLEEDESPIDLYAKSKDADKYGAINLKHKNTIEIRIFKGTLKVETFYNTLEFVSAMAHMAKDTDIYEIQFVTWDKIKSMFSDKLTQYIIEREETVKKEEKEKVCEMTRDRSTSYMRYTGVDYSTTYDYGNIPSFDSTDLPSNRIREELERISRMNIAIPSFEFNEYETQQIEKTEEEQLLEKIQYLKTKVRRSRNGLEITNLNRQIAELENKLRRLRMSNRSR